MLRAWKPRSGRLLVPGTWLEPLPACGGQAYMSFLPGQGCPVVEECSPCPPCLRFRGTGAGIPAGNLQRAHYHPLSARASPPRAAPGRVWMARHPDGWSGRVPTMPNLRPRSRESPRIPTMRYRAEAPAPLAQSMFRPVAKAMRRPRAHSHIPGPGSPTSGPAPLLTAAMIPVPPRKESIARGRPGLLPTLLLRRDAPIHIRAGSAVVHSAPHLPRASAAAACSYRPAPAALPRRALSLLLRKSVRQPPTSRRLRKRRSAGTRAVPQAPAGCSSRLLRHARFVASRVYRALPFAKRPGHVPGVRARSVVKNGARALPLTRWRAEYHPGTRKYAQWQRRWRGSTENRAELRLHAGQRARPTRSVTGWRERRDAHRAGSRAKARMVLQRGVLPGDGA